MLKGKVVWVTGSSRGIGRAVAHRMAADGAAVAVNCREDLDRANEVVSEIEGMGRGAILVQGDTTSPADVARMHEEIMLSLGTVDCLVNNAAYALLKPLLDIDIDEWISQVHLKALGYYLTTRSVLPGMVRSGGGVIINVLSTLAVRGGEGEAGYAVGNGAAMALTRSVAAEFGDRGIRCCGLMLMWAENAFNQNDPDDARWLENFPLGRVTRLEEIAATASFLASEHASAITGSAVAVDAGYLCR